MTPRVRPRKTDRTPTSKRLRELREALDPEPSQGALAELLGEGQMWVSRRERGKPEPSVDDAIRMAEGLGYAADLLIIAREQRELLAKLGEASPAEATLAIRVLLALPYFDDTARVVLDGLLEIAEAKAPERSSSG